MTLSAVARYSLTCFYAEHRIARRTLGGGLGEVLLPPRSGSITVPPPPAPPAPPSRPPEVALRGKPIRCMPLFINFLQTSVMSE